MYDAILAYNFLVIQFEHEELVEYEFDVDEKTCEEKYNGGIKPVMRGPSADVIPRVFKALTNTKLMIPGVDYLSKSGGQCVRASYKANDGYLYLLEKSFLFLRKPPIHIRHADVKQMSFERLSKMPSSGSRSFDVRMTLNTGEEYVFSSIQRDEFERMYEFLKKKNIDMASSYEGVCTQQ